MPSDHIDVWEEQGEAARPHEAEQLTVEVENLENFEVQHEEKDKARSVEKPMNSVPQIHPQVPYPQRLNKQREDKQFSKFLEVFKKLQINIPFAEALEQMPSYAKFMKGILSRKRRLDEFETVALTEKCSAVLQQKLPSKLKDPGSFTIPCTIGKMTFEKCLCDLGGKHQSDAFIIV